MSVALRRPLRQGSTARGEAGNMLRALRRFAHEPTVPAPSGLFAVSRSPEFGGTPRSLGRALVPAAGMEIGRGVGRCSGRHPSLNYGS